MVAVGSRGINFFSDLIALDRIDRVCRTSSVPGVYKYLRNTVICYLYFIVNRIDQLTTFFITRRIVLYFRRQKSHKFFAFSVNVSSSQNKK